MSILRRAERKGKKSPEGSRLASAALTCARAAPRRRFDSGKTAAGWGIRGLPTIFSGLLREAAEVGEDLRLLEAFYESDTRKLRAALASAGRSGPFVSQEERDALFISHGHAAG